MSRYSRIVPLSVLLAGAAACSDAGITSPVEEAPPPTAASQFSEQISLPELQQQTSSGVARVEVKLRVEGPVLIAREVEQEDDEAVREPERIEGRVTAAGDGTLTLALGGLQVSFDAATSFRSEGGDTLSQAEFVARVQEALAAGGEPSVEARRDAPAEPQAPDDPTFLATVLELDDEAAEPRLELNVDADNLRLNATAPPDAFLEVLGLSIEIRGSETELETRRPGKRAKAKFEGVVASVDEAAGTLTLLDQRIVRVVEGTEIEADDAGELRSLAEVAAALAAGQIVEAQGRGILESSEPTTIVAVEAEFEVEEEAEDVPDSGKVEGAVASVDVAGRTFTLASGAVVRIVDGTKVRGNKGISTLQEVADALAAQRAVTARTETVLESAGPPPVHIALSVKFKTDGPGKGADGEGEDDGEEGEDEGGDDDGDDGEDDGESEAVEFEAAVVSVSVDAGTFTLADGRAIHLTETTQVDAEGDLTTLQEVAAALAEGLTVKAEGDAVLEAEALVATRVGFEVE